ncbi:hypothetical protein L873DRAFT_1846053 [Choiromyces venosus 120613-1]|uniref:JmjC domain-containing protein n=1 Tax=Choiromyces venosus 120613-1 TaxID=1336337 RepID=A0A3N4JEE0_9PEZI|nr:hypothetical protein L873DRAFT_1846053 [Choiromyces venosus 120613-1]
MVGRKKGKAAAAPTRSSRRNEESSSRDQSALRTNIKKTGAKVNDENEEIATDGEFVDTRPSDPSSKKVIRKTPSSDQVTANRRRQSRSASLPAVNDSYKVDNDNDDNGSKQMNDRDDCVVPDTSTPSVINTTTGRKRKVSLVNLESGDAEIEETPKEPATKRTRSSMAKDNVKPPASTRTKRKGRAFPAKGDPPCGYVAIELTPEHEYVQKTPCQRNKELPEHCEACITKSLKTGGCRFNGIRRFKYDYAGRVEVDSTDHEFCVAGDQMSLKMLAQAAGQQEKMDKSPEAKSILPLIVPGLLTKLSTELYHEEFHGGILTKSNLEGGRRPMARLKKITLRTICDICSTTTMFGAYLSGCCGRELCLDCWTEWKPVVKDGEPTMPDKCTNTRLHDRESFYFVTRAYPGELHFLISSIRAYQDKANLTSVDNSLIPDIPIDTPVHPGDKGPIYLGTPTAYEGTVSQPQFKKVWSQGGIPLVIKGLKKKFTLPWDPKFFIDEYGKQACAITDCGSGDVGGSTVGRFFETFAQTESENGRRFKSLKLKDWPPESDFKDVFPKLFEDFEGALPFPEYTRREASLNLVSRLPSDWTRPDLGPKMYNAYPAPDFLPTKNGKPNPVKGTTNLHFDMTDAVNILVHQCGGPTPAANKEWEEVHGYPKCGAIWDIFPPDSAPAIRRYLKKQDDSVDDPLNRPYFYLTEKDLIELGKPEYNVRSYRIYQSAGDAVFVPAGCPHQVRNKESCIKVAVDFFSAENAAICTTLLEDFRHLAKATLGKVAKRLVGKRDDVLQPYNCLLFNWIKISGKSFERAVKAGKIDLETGKLVDEVGDSGEVSDLDEPKQEKCFSQIAPHSSKQRRVSVSLNRRKSNRRNSPAEFDDGDHEAVPKTFPKRAKKAHVEATPSSGKKSNKRNSPSDSDESYYDNESEDYVPSKPKAKKARKASVRAPAKGKKTKVLAVPGVAVTEVQTSLELEAAPTIEADFPSKVEAVSATEAHSPSKVEAVSATEAHSPSKVETVSATEAHSPPDVETASTMEGHSSLEVKAFTTQNGHSASEVEAPTTTKEAQTTSKIETASTTEAHSPSVTKTEDKPSEDNHSAVPLAPAT